MSDYPLKISEEGSEGYLSKEEGVLLKLFVEQNAKAIWSGEINKLKVYQYNDKGDKKKHPTIKNPYWVEVGNHLVELHLSRSVLFDISDGQNIRPFVLYEKLGKGTFAKGIRGRYVDLNNPEKPGMRGVAKAQKFFEPVHKKMHEREMRGLKKVGGLLGRVVRPVTSVTSTTQSRQNPKGDPMPVPIGYLIEEDKGIDLKQYLDLKEKTGTLTGTEILNIGIGVFECEWFSKCA